jgi:hypothetical protein
MIATAASPSRAGRANVGDVIRSLHGAGAFMIITLTIVAEEDP